MASYLISIYFLIFYSQPPNVIEIHQIGWSITNKWPIEADYIVNYRLSKANYRPYELVKNKKRADRILTNLNNQQNTDSIEVKDLRLVALITEGGIKDTLVIDKDGDCLFQNKKFKLDKELAYNLGVRHKEFNPRFKYKSYLKFRRNNQDWE